MVGAAGPLQLLEEQHTRVAAFDDVTARLALMVELGLFLFVKAIVVGVLQVFL